MAGAGHRQAQGYGPKPFTNTTQNTTHARSAGAHTACHMDFRASFGLDEATDMLLLSFGLGALCQIMRPNGWDKSKTKQDGKRRGGGLGAGSP